MNCFIYAETKKAKMKEGAEVEGAFSGEPEEENMESPNEKEVAEDADGSALPLGLTGKLFQISLDYTKFFVFF